MADMAIRIRPIDPEFVQIVSMFRVKRARDLPSAYMTGYPKVFQWDDGKGISVVMDHRVGKTVKCNDVMHKMEFDILVDSIRASGNRLHEIMKTTPKDTTTQVISI